MAATLGREVRHTHTYVAHLGVWQHRSNPMGLDQLGVLTSGTLVPKEVVHSLFLTPCLPYLPGLRSNRSSLAPQGHHIRAYPMQHVVNRALTRWVAANLISGNLAHAGNHMHG